jgi:protein N-lysine methyltransferase METTL21A
MSHDETLAEYDFFKDDGPKITDTGATPLPLKCKDSSGETTYSLDVTPSCRLVLAHDPLVGTGGLLWPAGEVLARYLLTPTAASHASVSLLKDKKVVELGSGTGVVGLSCAAAMGDCKHRGSLVLTDLHQVLPILRRNVDLNDLADSVSVRALPWGEGVPDDLTDCDVVLAADCVYLEHLFQPLIDTLQQLMVKEGAVAYLSYKKRRKADTRFFKLLRKRFLVQKLDAGALGTDRDNIHLYRVNRK